MTSLLDIGPLTAKVTVRGKEFEVRGISAKMFFHLLDDFPELRKVMSGAKVEVKAEDMMKQVPGAVSSVIAAACGMPNDKEAIAKADDLTIGEQADFMTKIWELTFPSGVTSFIVALEEMSRATGAGWGQDTPSPGALNNSSPAATPKKASGVTLQG